MHRALFALVVVTVGLLGACSKEQRICRRMGELCETDADECSSMVGELKRAGGNEAVAKLERCYADADTCSEAKGCEARVTLESAASAVGEFFEGLTDDDDKRSDER